MSDYLSVGELIQKLEKYPKETLVMVDGYEGGLDAVLDTKSLNVEYDATKQWWYGPFEESEKAKQRAVYLISTRDERL